MNFTKSGALAALAFFALFSAGCSSQADTDNFKAVYIVELYSDEGSAAELFKPPEGPDRLSWARESFREEAHHNRLRVVQEIADSIGYDWRGTGSSVNYGCPLTTGCACSIYACHYGTISGFLGHTVTDVWIFPSAFFSFEHLHYVVLHEIAHVWQVQHRGWEDDYEDFSEWLPTGVDPMEATADCLAKVWGASPVGFSYWNCPTPAEEYMRKVYRSSDG